MSEKVHVTQEGLDKLNEERNNLIHNVRKEVIEELKAAREQGDLSENADYDAARDRQSRVEARISELEIMLRNTVLIVNENTGPSKTVRLGSTVKVLDKFLNEEIVYAIVGSVEADPLNGKLSNEAPIAQAMLGSSVDDVVKVEVEDPYEIKILEIN